MVPGGWSTSIITNSLDHYFGRGDPLRLALLPNQLYFESVLEVVEMYLRADVCKYRPEVGKMNFLKNPQKIM